VAVALAASGSVAIIGAQESGRQRAILVFYGQGRETQIAVTAERELKDALGLGLKDSVDYYAEYLDDGRFSTAHQDAYREYLGLKYSEHQLDLVIAVGDSALEFVARHRSQLFPDAPIVFFGRNPGAVPTLNSTGVIATVDFTATLDLAVTLQPGLEQVFVVSGAGEGDRALAARVRPQFKPFESQLAITYLAGLTTDDLERRLSALPERAAVYYLIVNQDGAGEFFHPLDYLSRLASVANRPIYSWVDSTIDRGVVGGYMESQPRQMNALAELALRVLRGEPADSIPTARLNLDGNVVDWRQLRRWGISEARVPAGATILFKETGPWARYQPYILAATVLLLAQTGLIAGLLVQSVRRRRAEEAVRESETRFRLLFEAAPVMVWMSGIDKQCIDFNRSWLDFTGRTLEEELGDGWTAGVHPDDLARCLETYSQAFDGRETFRMEYRLRRHDGAYRWIIDSGVPRFAANGSFVGYIGSALDVTDLKRARTVLANLNRELMAAHEEERAWIARELHDDLAQRVVGLTLQLRSLVGMVPDTAGHLATQLRDVCSGYVELGRQVQTVSRRLHASKLEYLGLAAAATDLCRETSLERSVSIDFSHEGMPPEVSKEVALALFRVLQESLSNAVKHSGTRRVVARLRGTHDQIHLEVADTGAGFDPEQALRDGGLGLVSMRERMRLVGGELEIQSASGKGTTLLARAPWRHPTHLEWPHGRVNVQPPPRRPSA
jgi:PAS domain S-box-containing protein